MGSSDDAFATETDGDTTETDMDVDADSDNDDFPSLSDSCPFSEGEKVLAYHNLHIYPAKVRRIEFRLREWKYFVHYLGWSKKTPAFFEHQFHSGKTTRKLVYASVGMNALIWDEWVGMDRLMKFSEENVKKQKALEKKQGIDKNTKPMRTSQIKPKNYARGKKRMNDSITKEKGVLPVEQLVNIQIPLVLKKQLVDDFEFITHLGKLVKLPRAPSVDKILKKYLDYRMKKDGMISDSVGEFLNGLRCYFEKALPVMLLYKRERQQYEEAMGNNVSPSTIYGAEHLLRLFVKLPELLFHANIKKDTLIGLQLELLDFLRFLQKNQSAFFLTAYISSTTLC